MQDIKSVYPDLLEEGEETFYGPGNYQPMLESLGYPILVQVDDNDYQGDSRLLLSDGLAVGYLQFDWGSCSGCDALQACSTYRELDGLRESLFKDIKWFNTAEEALAWFKSHDWEGDYSWREESQKKFVDEVTQCLTPLENST